MSSSDRTVHLLGTGGTIANVTGTYGDEDDFDSVDALLETAPQEIAEVAPLSYTEITRLPSQALSPSVWFALYDEIVARVADADPPDGFVVTHGSNTSAETAYFLSLVLETEIPVVVTAAQRHSRAIGSERFRNLYDAIRVASDPNARGRGVLLVANEEIHHARDVTKLAASRPDAWKSPNTGRIGDAAPDIRLYQTPNRPAPTQSPVDLGAYSVDDFPLTDVYVVYSSFAASGRLVDAAVENDASGIVVAAYPTANPAEPDGLPQQQEALERAVEVGVPVVICNRGLQGFKRPDDRFISGETLQPEKARILLALGLMESNDFDELQELFRRF